MFTYINMLVMDWSTMMPSSSTIAGRRCFHGLNAVLHVQHRHVRIRAGLEDDQNRRLAGTGAGRDHVTPCPWTPLMACSRMTSTESTSTFALAPG